MTNQDKPGDTNPSKIGPLPLSVAAPKLRSEIDRAIERLLEIGRCFDPLPIISHVAVILQFHDPEKHQSASDTGEPQVEHLVSLLLSQAHPSPGAIPTPDILQECFDLLESIQHKYPMFYYGSTRNPDDLRADVMINTQFVRGEAYAYHVQKQFLELGATHDDFLEQYLGFTSVDILSLLRHAHLQINSAVNNRMDRSSELCDEIVRLHEQKTGSVSAGTRFEQAVAAVNDLEFRSNNDALVGEFIARIESSAPPEVLEITARSSKDGAILDALSTRFGENVQFVDVPKWRGWPLNPSAVHHKPFILHEGRYYLPLGPLAFRSAFALLEDIIARTDSSYWQHRFLPARDAYLERKSGELLESMLPGCRVYSNLRYDFQADGETRLGEVDKLVLYDDAIFIVESKAGKFSAEARRGAPKGLRQDAEELLDKAFIQGTRVVNRLRGEAEVSFRDGTGQVVLRVREADFRYKFVITVTFESLAVLQTNLHAVRKLGLIQGKEWPWAVCLSDFRVIAELTDHPSTFVHYLTRRIQANDIEALNVSDELEIFGFYRAGQLFFPVGQPLDCTHMTLSGFTEEMDAYYEGLGGWRRPTSKPKQPLSPGIEKLLMTLEQRRPRHFLSACIDLLDIDGKTAEKIESGMAHLQQALVTRRRPQAMILSFEHDNRLLVVGCTQDGKCPPLTGFPGFNAAVAKVKPARVTAIFFAPPLGVGEVSILV